MPIFAAVGLVFPAVLTIITFASNRALGPVVTGALGNLSPLLSVARRGRCCCTSRCGCCNSPGLMVAVLGVLTITVTRTDDMRDWRTWALLLPLGASVLRGVIPPVIKIGLEIWPSPIAAGLTGYIVSHDDGSAGGAHPHRAFHRAGAAGRPAVVRASPASATASARCCSMRRSAPGRSRWWRRSYATYPLFTVGLSVLFLGECASITWRLVAGIDARPSAAWCWFWSG